MTKKETLLGHMFAHAVLTLTSKIAVAEKLGVSSDRIMKCCVLPILNEVKNRCKSINGGNLNTPVDGFNELCSF